MVGTLYSKLALALASLFCVIGLLFLIVMRMSFATYHDAVTQKLNRPMAGQLVAEHVESKLRAGGLAAVREHFDTLMLTNPAIELYMLDAAGNILAYHAPKKKVVRQKVDLAPLRAMLADSPEYPVLGDDPRDPVRRKIFSVAPVAGSGDAAGYLYVIIGGEQYDAVANELANSFVWRQGAWIMVSGLLFATLTGLLIFAVLTGKLRRLTMAMEAFRRSDFRERILVPARQGRDEIDRLADTYNAIVERVTTQLKELQDHDEARRDMIANVSHDLRTPIASLRGYLETLLLKRDTASPEELRNYLEIATRQSERLAALVAELFELAKLDARDAGINPEPFQLAELAHDVLHKFELEAGKKRIRLVGTISPEAPFVRADIGLIERVLQNLLENALRHTPEGGEVRLIVAAGANSSITVEVRDSGSGIPEAEVPFIFDRFYRVDKSRNLASGGAGLGLAISKRILDLHQSVIEVESALGRGTTFRFALQTCAAVA